MRPAERPLLASDLAGTAAHAGVDPTWEDGDLHDALRRAIAHRRGSGAWDIDQASCKWVVILHSLEKSTFPSRTVQEALARCLVCLMVKGTGHPRGLA